MFLEFFLPEFHKQKFNKWYRAQDSNDMAPNLHKLIWWRASIIIGPNLANKKDISQPTGKASRGHRRRPHIWDSIAPQSATIILPDANWIWPNPILVKALFSSVVVNRPKLVKLCHSVYHFDISENGELLWDCLIAGTMSTCPIQLDQLCWLPSVSYFHFQDFSLF